LTGSGWLDLLIIAVALLAAISGWRHGALASGLALVGVIIGAVIGIMLAPHVVVLVDDQTGRLLAGIVLIVLLVLMGQVCGMVIGRTARDLITIPALRAIDSAIGSVFQAGAVLVAAYLLAIPIASVANPQAAAAVRGSSVLAEIDSIAPPWLQQLPKDFSNLIDTSGLPQVLGPFGRTPIAAVEPPNPALQASPVVLGVEGSVPKIRGVATSCQKALEGSGVVLARGIVMTNAHVVSGTEGVTVETVNGVFDATVIYYDARNDIAVLSVPGLTAAPLPLITEHADTGSDAIVLGYPGGGPYTASPARIREVLNLSGPDIYQIGTVEREVYTVRGTVRQGNSGGPLINSNGEVIGIVFGAAADDPNTGFALTGAQVQPLLAAALANATAVATGSCVP
jgi:S1-C subfamily serine protease